MRVFGFLFASDDLPVALQVFWKLLLFSLASIVGYAASSSESVGGKIILAILGFSVFALGLLTKLGQA